MKKLWLVSILLIAVVAVVCVLWYLQSRTGEHRSGGQAIAKPEVMAHLPLTGLRQQGAILIGRLESPMVIDGYPCDANWAHFNEAGKLRAFFLSDTCMIQGNRIPKGTWIRLHPDQTIRFCSFPEDTVIQGHLCDGGSGGAEGVTASFYPGGKLGGFYAPQDVEIQGIPCRASPINGIGLHENGNLETFTLARDTVIGGRSLSAGQHVALDEAGNVKSVEEPPIYERPLAWITKVFPGH